MSRWPGLLLLLTIAMSLVPASRADMGSLVVDEVSGSVRVMVFASPVPLRAGRSEWTVFVLDARTRAPLTPAATRLHLHPPQGETEPGSHAHHTAMQEAEIAGGEGRLFFDLGRSGPWTVMIELDGPTDDGQVAPVRVTGEVTVLPAHTSGGAEVWALVLPYFAIACFAASQRSAERRRRRAG